MTFLREKHIQYVKDLDSKYTKETLEYWLSEHLRMNGLYWGVTALSTMGVLEETLPKDEVCAFVDSCWDSEYGGFGAYPGHDAHLLSTLSAIQIYSIYGEIDALKASKGPQLVKFLRGLQILPTGSFQGDRFGEVDTRFVYAALSGLSILGQLTQEVVNPAVSFILKCQNFDGGFGMVPGGESHAAQVFTCLGALAIADALPQLSKDRKDQLCSWLSERQVLPLGGLNGRPEKLPDVCYSWWVVSLLAILGKLHWIDAIKLKQFILQCQDIDAGGFSDRPDNQTDVYHTCFGITGLSLLSSVLPSTHHEEEHRFVAIDPVYCMPTACTAKFKPYKFNLDQL